MTTSALTQLRALFRLRWQMIRSDSVRVAMILVLVFLGWLMLLVAGSASRLEPAAVTTAVELAPQAFLGFGLLAIIAPLTAGGGNDVLPPDQLVAFPVKPRTQFLGGIALAPINLVWLLQILALIAETAFLTAGGNRLAGAATSLAYVAAITALGQAAAWTVVGLRQSRRGRTVVAFTGAGILLAVLVLVKTGLGTDLLDHSPTRAVIDGISAGADGAWGRWALTTGALAAVAVLSLALGARTCGWALRRPGDAGAQRASRVVPRRAAHASPLRTLVAVDRASVWRAPALRRGGIVLAVLPSAAAAGAQVPSESLIILPGLVAAGAGLLFGINAFCLDAGGAVLLASLPHDPRLIARSKALVLTETVVGAAALTVVAGFVRSPGSPTTTQVIAIVLSALTCSAIVVARGMAGSVRRPHKAELQGPRDAVAPPGALTLASAGLVLPTIIAGVVFQGSSATDVWWAPLAVTVPLLALCAWSLHRSMGRYADPVIRSRIVQVVSAG
ncbi:MAG: hypothetical protein JWO12_441 [Frankiales bacterium]|nr:hypothetical protein [Frankiales bacterium]